MESRLHQASQRDKMRDYSKLYKLLIAYVPLLIISLFAFHYALPPQGRFDEVRLGFGGMGVLVIIAALIEFRQQQRKPQR